MDVSRAFDIVREHDCQTGATSSLAERCTRRHADHDRTSKPRPITARTWAPTRSAGRCVITSSVRCWLRRVKGAFGGTTCHQHRRVPDLHGPPASWSIGEAVGIVAAQSSANRQLTMRTLTQGSIGTGGAELFEPSTAWRADRRQVRLGTASGSKITIVSDDVRKWCARQDLQAAAAAGVQARRRFPGRCSRSESRVEPARQWGARPTHVVLRVQGPRRSADTPGFARSGGLPQSVSIDKHIEVIVYARCFAPGDHHRLRLDEFCPGCRSTALAEFEAENAVWWPKGTARGRLRIGHHEGVAGPPALAVGGVVQEGPLGV